MANVRLIVALSLVKAIKIILTSLFFLVKREKLS